MIANHSHPARRMAEPFFKLTFEQIRECLAPLRDSLGCRNLFAYVRRISEEPDGVARYKRVTGKDLGSLDPLASHAPSEQEQAEFDKGLRSMEFAGDGPVTDGNGNPVQKEPWSREAKIENHLLYVVSVPWGLALYCGPDGGDWGWDNTTPWSEWPEPNRSAWAAACEHAKAISE